MKQFNKSDAGLIENLVLLSQDELHNAMAKYLRQLYPKVINTRDYIVAWGEIPVALVAHMDTVFLHQEKHEVYYDREKGVMWKLDGAGFDDRAGVFGIIKILQAGYRPTIIFTRDEEVGGIGAEQLVKQIPQALVPIKYFIELDRQGSNDCVFYNCGNDEFIKYVESFGFCEEWGTFSDISIICPEWGIAGVNLSIGYYNEHTIQETLHVSQTLATIEKVKKMLDAVEDASFFVYVYRKFSIEDYYFNKYGIKITRQEPMEVICAGCGTVMSEYNSIPVISEDGSTKFYCGECLPNNVDFCIDCGEAFELNGIEDDLYCPVCRAKHIKRKK